MKENKELCWEKEFLENSKIQSVKKVVLIRVSKSYL